MKKSLSKTIAIFTGMGTMGYFLWKRNRQVRNSLKHFGKETGRKLYNWFDDE